LDIHFSSLRSFRKAITEYTKNPDIRHRNYCMKRAVFHGIRMVNSQPEETLVTRDDYVERFNFICIVKSLIGLLTPKDFVNIFPITKEYDGHKWGSKDYFYTREYVDGFNQDEPIGSDNKVLELLYEYHNREISRFVVNSMLCMSELRRFEGKPSLAEEWAEEHGLKTYSLYTDNKGNQFLLDSKTGKTAKVTKPKPRRPKHFKVIK